MKRGGGGGLSGFSGNNLRGQEEKQKKILPLRTGLYWNTETP